MADRPKKPNMGAPKKPAGQTPQPSQGALNEMTKTLREIRDMQAAEFKEKKEDSLFERKLMVAEQVEQLHMINIMKAVEESIKKNTDKLDKKFSEDAKTQKEIAQTIKDSIKSGEKTSEEENEDAENEKKRWKAFAESIKKGFGVGVEKGKGFLSGLWDMIKKFKTLLLVIGLGTILANIKVGDLKKTWLKVKEFFVATKEFFTPIAEWLKEDFFPSTMELFFSSMDNVTKLFKDLTKDFDGFMDKGFVGKSESILKSIKDIGRFTGQFFMDVVDWTGGLLGKEGKISDDIKDYLDKFFRPDVSAKIYSLLEIVGGAFLATRLLGGSPLKWTKWVTTKLGGAIWMTTTWAVGFITRILGIATATLSSPAGIVAVGGAVTAIMIDRFRDDITKFFTDFWRSVRNTIGRGLHAMNPFADGEYVDETAESRMADNAKRITELKEQIQYFKERDNLIKNRPHKYNKTEDLLHGQQFDLAGRRVDSDVMMKILGHHLKQAEEEMRNDKVSTGKLKLDRTFPTNQQDNLMGNIKSPMGDLTKSLEKIKDWGTGFTDVGKDYWKFSSDYIDQTMKNEDFREYAYPDAGGSAIGYGFRLNKSGAAEILKKAGVDKSVSDLMSKKEKLTREEALSIYLAEKSFFTNAAKNWIGETEWTKLNKGQQQALYDMSYNMGAGFYQQGNWPDLKKAIIANDDSGIYSGVMMNSRGDGPSKYVGDVGHKRAMQNITALQKDGLDLVPFKDRQYDGQPMVATIDQSTNTETNQLFNGSGRSAKSTYKNKVSELAGGGRLTEWVAGS